MASNHLIDAYLAELARRLPTDAVDEISDGLAEAWQHYRGLGLSSTDAAKAATAEFGTTTEVAAAFVANAPGRRAAKVLLASGPVIGIVWGASLIAGRAWSWPVPGLAAAVFAAALVACVACLVLAATSRRDYRRTRLGHVGAIGLLALDGAMIAAALLAAPAVVWPMALAIAASAARIALTARYTLRAWPA